MFLPNNNRCTAGGIPVLVGLLCSDRLVVQCMATGVLCYSSENRKVCEDLVHHGAVLVGIKLCSGHQPELHSRCAVILAILVGHSEHHQNLIAQLVTLNKCLQDVLVNAVRCIRTLCIKSPCNQTAVAHAGGVPHLDKFLSVNSEVLQEEACLALAELAWGHWKNQRLICEAGAICALVQALRERKIPVKVKAATVLESIASHNPAIQQCFLRQSSAKCFQLEVQEQGATALWALAGQTLKQQKLMAEQMGYLLILDLLLSSSDKMQYVGKARYKLVLLYTVPKEITQFHPTNQSPMNVSNTLAAKLSSRQKKTVRTFITVEAYSCVSQSNSRSDEVTSTARGVTVLTVLLQSDQSTTVVITAQLFASLVHTRAGITNAIVTMGAVEHLSVQTACASALDARISQLFTAEFERQRRIGFPSLSLEINGGPPVPHRDNKRMNARCSQSVIGDRETPALLPHHARQRARTAKLRVRMGQTSCHNAPKQRLNENT
uniref:Ankyrin and armadillo repeat containing n=1 Tax=Sinocyclocheilus grahami TaxID=75366 RepID=A0A672QUB5_SINGR